MGSYPGPGPAGDVPQGGSFSTPPGGLPPPMGPGTSGSMPPVGLPPMGPGISGAMPPVGAPPLMGSGPLGSMPPMGPGGAPVMVGGGPRWRALRTVSGLYKFFAWIEAGIGVIGALIALVLFSQVNVFVGLIGALAILLYAAIAFITLLAGSEGILVFLAIEENTRGKR